ncbi:ABC transporter substrate-binding protein [Noviherbaspirillum sedimenti]|uniref:ABC transporter substrate-binding protein n=1 Tax=Noviherbaspirillum sedimenti TaxID=2320865 RepID=A0A3A3G3P3_9BURK|nr:ABC transporter substrate-binding protein [Noviherbaspirillum sedimenti]RJG02285.1 ABC transporter substrate-binding protein [Noviherbaspirillum sedimenti]
MLRTKQSLAAILLAFAGAAQAQISDGVVKIGVLTDMSGPYSGMGGPGSVVAARMAIDDCLKAECKGLKIEVIYTDHQNKADIVASKAREWLDSDHVDAMADLTNSAGALAVQKMIKEKGGIALYSGPATTRLTNEDCAVNGFHWMFDTYSAASGTAAALTRKGSKSWYFVSVDYAFGASLEKDASEVVKSYGGTVLGSVRHPLNANDFSSFLLQAQAAKPQVIGLANGAQDTVNAIKAAREFGLGGKNGPQVAALLVFLSDVRSMGLDVAQGLIFSEGFYWDMDEQTRAFSSRFEKLHKGNKPTMVQAGVYSSVLHYLKSVAAAKTDDWKVVAQKMRELPIQDAVMRNATIRPDGRVAHDMYLFQVKKPSESKGGWDYYNTLATIPAQIAFKPLAESTCPLVKQAAK